MKPPSTSQSFAMSTPNVRPSPKEKPPEALRLVFEELVINGRCKLTKPNSANSTAFAFSFNGPMRPKRQNRNEKWLKKDVRFFVENIFVTADSLNYQRRNG